MNYTHEGMGVPVGGGYGHPMLGLRNDAQEERTNADRTFVAVAVDSRGRLLLGQGAGITPIGDHTSNGSLSAVVTLTPPAGATLILIEGYNQNVRFTLDGTTPTATVGFVLRPTDPPIIIDVSPATTLKMIEETASAAIQYQWGA